MNYRIDPSAGASVFVGLFSPTKASRLICIAVLALSFSMSLFVVNTIAAEHPYQLQSGQSTLVLDEHSGYIKALAFAGRSLLTKTDIQGPFRIHLPIEDFYAHIIEGQNARPVIIKNNDQLICTYKNVNGKRGPIDISVQITMKSMGDGSFELSCSIHNKTGITIPQVFFPWIGGFKQIKNNSDQVRFGKSSFRPWDNWASASDSERMKFLSSARLSFTRDPVSGTYPAGMKWMDYYADSMGVSLYSKDTGARLQNMVVSCDNYGDDGIDLAWSYYPFIAPGETWNSPELVLYPHEGDWRYGVLKFKEFADKAFVPVKSTNDRDLTLGQYSLWMSWHYQDWQDVKYRYSDIPSIAAEAREAGFREMTICRSTELDFCLPHVLRPQMGTAQELKQALQKTRELGVNTTLWVTCRIIRPETIPEDQNKNEWYFINAAGQPVMDNFTYDPLMIPPKSIQQIGTRGGYKICTASENWQKAYWDNLEMATSEWGYRGIFFDLSYAARGLCFNALHNHKPDGEGAHGIEVYAKTREILQQKFGEQATFSGECQWDVATQWMDFTWDWLLMDNEKTAPFYMAFPRARKCYKTDQDRALINKIFTAGYWLDVYLERKDGTARMSEYPEMVEYFKTLAVFKKRFVRFLSQRDTYLYNMYVKVNRGKDAWVRTHKHGDESLMMVTNALGGSAAYELEIDLKQISGLGRKKIEVWTRSLKKLSSQTAEGRAVLKINVPRQDFVSVLILPDRE